MSFRYASCLYSTASRAATACAYDYVTACGSDVASVRGLTADELEALVATAAGEGWTFGETDPESSYEDWGVEDVDYERLAKLIAE